LIDEQDIPASSQMSISTIEHGGEIRGGLPRPAGDENDGVELTGRFESSEYDHSDVDRPSDFPVPIFENFISSAKDLPFNPRYRTRLERRVQVGFSRAAAGGKQKSETSHELNVKIPHGLP
jgi:hypothetical protein